MTFHDWVQRCRQDLEQAGAWFGHGTDNALDEAAWLVLSAAGMPVDGSFSGWALETSAKQDKRINDLLRSRVSLDRPLAYLTGEAWFCGLKFMVDERVLVPRSPIAELISQQFSPWVDAERLEAMLDLCTGCGCIGIASALAMPWVRVDATDISSGALQVAQANRELHGLDERVDLIESDLFAALEGRSYELIVSNPPYVSKSAFESLPPEYHAEPEMALVTGCSGLEIPLQILLQAPDYLEKGGVLICEVGENAGLLVSMLPQLPFSWLEFENGGEGVFTIGRQALFRHRPTIASVLEKLRDVA